MIHVFFSSTRMIFSECHESPAGCHPYTMFARLYYTWCSLYTRWYECFHQTLSISSVDILVRPLGIDPWRTLGIDSIQTSHISHIYKLESFFYTMSYVKGKEKEKTHIWHWRSKCNYAFAPKDTYVYLNWDLHTTLRFLADQTM